MFYPPLSSDMASWETPQPYGRQCICIWEIVEKSLNYTWWISSPVRLQECHRFMVFLWQSTSEYIGATLITDSGNKRLGLLHYWYCVPPGPSKCTQGLLTFPRHMGVGVGRIMFLGIWEEEIIKDATSIGILSTSYMLFYTALTTLEHVTYRNYPLVI